MKVEIEVSEKRLARLAAPALRRGALSREWLFGVEPLTEVPGREGLEWYTSEDFWASEFAFSLDVLSLDELGHDERVVKIVTKADANLALELMATGHAKHFGDLMRDRLDEVTSDVFLQLCAFGRVLYG